MQSTETPPTLLDDSDLGQVLRISRARVKKLADAGRLPKPLLIDGLRRWTPDSIAAWLRSQQSTVTTDDVDSAVGGAA